MTPKQVHQFVDRREEWFGAKVSEKTRETVWEPALADIAPDIAVEAMKRYARKQRNNYPPSLDDLLEHCEAVQHERDRAAIQARRAEEDQQAAAAWKKAWEAHPQGWPQRTTADVVGAVLEEAARDPWAAAHIQMHEKGLNRPGREQEAAAYCWGMAQEHPTDGDRWAAEATWYAGGAQGDIAWSTPMSRGEAVVPQMWSREPGEEG